MTSIEYARQLREKVDRLQTLLMPFDAPTAEVFPSPEKHYRMRAEFRIWHEQNDLCYAMFEKGQKASSASLRRIEEFPAANTAINALMPHLLDGVRNNPILKNRWYQCEFLATLSGEMLVSMIYHKKLDHEWEQAARVLQDKLGIGIIGRSRGQKYVLSRDFVCEKLTIHGKNFVYQQIEGGFTQPNARICEKMLEWACAAAEGAGGDLLELYCGNGNFTLPLAQYFRNVLATEVSKTSVQAAQYNIQANGVNNIRIARLSAEEFAQAFLRQRVFHRLAEQQIDLDSYDFSTVFVDPPRAGIDDDTLRLLSGFERIIYVSCNPESLSQNLVLLSRTHCITRTALFDQFPFTPHIESAVLLQRM